MVATPDQVESVLFGDDPAAEALPIRRGRRRDGDRRTRPVNGGPSGSGRSRSTWSTRRSPAAPPCRRRDLLIMVGGTRCGSRSRATAARRDGPQCTATSGQPRRRAEGQARQPVAVRRPHRCGRRGPRSRRGDAARPGATWRSSAAGRRLVHVRRPRGTHGARRPTRSRVRSTSSSRTWASSPTPPAPALPGAAGLGGRTALPCRPPRGPRPPRRLRRHRGAARRLLITQVATRRRVAAG